jgi:glutamate-1-semialdehyde aminotransferase
MHPGTFNGNVPTMVGGLATMHELDAIAIARMNEAAAKLAAKIEAAGQQLGIPILVTYSGSIMQVHFASASGHLPESSSTVRSERLAQLHLALLLQGVYAAPRGMLNLSTQMSDKDHEFIVASYEQAFARLKDLGWG